jgi:hypothetical protein
MKKYLTGLTALALAIAFSAFSAVPEKADNGQSIRWAKTNLDGTLPASPQIYTGTTSQARAEFSCPDDGSQFCAKEVNLLNQPVSGGAVIMRE